MDTMTRPPAPEPGIARDALCIELIRRDLVTEHVGFQTYLFQEVASTNAVLRRLAEAGAREGTTVLAEAQSAGRGRLGKRWFSPPWVNLYASVLFRPSIPVPAVPVFSFIASLAVSDTIRREGVSAKIKWPNDVVIDGKKVAGTLVSYALAGDLVEHVILGVGVNLNVAAEDLEAALGEAAAQGNSVGAAAGRPIDRNRFAATFLNLLERWAGAYATRGSAAVLEAWRERDVLAGRRVALVEGGRPPQEVWVLGVSSEGRLIVESAGGARRELISGEIRLREAA